MNCVVKPKVVPFEDLFGAPTNDPNCEHSNWAVYYSYKIKVCVDCKGRRDFNGTKIEHQR
jgi:hypothetical protein